MALKINGVRVAGIGSHGKDGEGVVPGGTTGQVLAKSTDIDYDTQWVDLPTYTAEDVGADVSGSAEAALISAKQYTDDQIAAIPTPDVSGQIEIHNTDTSAHEDIRTAVGVAQTRADTAMNGVSTKVSFEEAQSLTEVQQSRARSNIAAASSEELNNKVTLEGGGTITIEELLGEAPYTIEFTTEEEGISASDIDYDGSSSGLSATNVQGAIDNLKTEIENINIETDETPTENSVNPVQSGGVYTAINGVRGYVDDQIAAIPTPDVSGQIDTHNTSTTAHTDIRTAISAAQTRADNAYALADSALQSYTETDPTVPAWAKASTKPTYTASEVGASPSDHNHDGVYAPVYEYGTEDLTAGTSPLETGKLYFVYE